MNKELKNKAVNLRLSKRQNDLVKQLASKEGETKGSFIRRKLFGINQEIIDPSTEIDYTPEEREEDRLKILEQLEWLNKHVLTNLPNVPYARRQSVLNQLDTLTKLLDLKRS